MLYSQYLGINLGVIVEQECFMLLEISSQEEKSFFLSKHWNTPLPF